MRSVRPQPRIEVELGGEPLAEADAENLGVLRVQQKLSLPTQCELTFFDPGGPLAQARTPRLGDGLRVAVVGQPEVLFVGEITAVEYTYGPDRGRCVHVRGYDLLHRLRKRQQIRSLERGTLDQLVGSLVEEDGLDVRIASEDRVAWLRQGPRLIQNQASDFDWLCELARRSGHFFLVREDLLNLFTLKGTGDSVRLVLGENLFEASIEVNAERACDEVSTEGWDPLRVGACTGRADQARVGREVAADVEPRKLGGSGKVRLLDASSSSNEQAVALAQQELDHRTATEVVLGGVAEGDTRLHPGRPVEVTGVAERLAGRHVLTWVTHTIDRERGYLSELGSDPPRNQPNQHPLAAMLGVVCDVDDPDELGRIRAELPPCGGVETDWMRVMAPAAGNGKGLVTLPAVGDHVLLLLVHGDPAQGVVLGGLYRESGPPDPGVEGDRVLRYTLQTDQGQRMLLDDGNGLLRMENDEGSFVELSPDGMALHAERDLLIEAPGRRITIRGDRVDFERG